MLHRAIEQCSNSSRPACSSCWLVNIFNHTHSPSNPSEMISSFFFRSLLSGYVTFFSALSNKPPPFFFYFHSCLVFTFFVLLRLYSLASRPATCLTFCLCLTVETLDLVAVLTERGNHRMARFGVLFFFGSRIDPGQGSIDSDSADCFLCFVFLWSGCAVKPATSRS